MKPPIIVVKLCIALGLRTVRLASSTFLSEQISHQQPVSSTLPSEHTSTSRTGCKMFATHMQACCYTVTCEHRFGNWKRKDAGMHFLLCQNVIFDPVT
jgi:hypothetical protein